LPAEVLPARELLADLLLELNDPAAALKEYEQSVSTERNRFRSILGIARAAKQTGDTSKARGGLRQARHAGERRYRTS
jgi:Tfp pilus assembly protein PilF